MGRGSRRSQGSETWSVKVGARRRAPQRVDRILDARERTRRFFESLESRLHLSGTHDAALVAAIQSALSTANSSGFSAWSHKLTDPTILGRQLPIAGGGLGTGYDPQAQLNT